MSLQVIGPAGKGSKAVLWSETRMPRQTWRIDSQGRIHSQMFEDMVLDIKGEASVPAQELLSQGPPKMGGLAVRRGTHPFTAIRSMVCPPETLPSLRRWPILRPGPRHRLGRG